MLRILLPLLGLLLCSSIVHAEQMVTVKLLNYVGNTNEVTIKIEGDFFTLDQTLNIEEGVKYRLFLEKGNLYIKQKGQKKQKITGGLILVPKSYDTSHLIYINDRPYLGAMEFTIEDKQSIRPVNQLPLEDYLKGVVPFEVFSSWGMETLKAQTLAARTYAVSKLGQVIDDTVSYQAYGGFKWDKQTTQAVNETIGEVITHQNRLIETFYSASNGGMTESNQNVWGGKAMQYFPIKQDPYDPINPWGFSLHQIQIDYNQINFDDPNWWNSLEEKDSEIINSMKSWLNRNGYPGEIKILSIPKFEVEGPVLDSLRSVNGSISIHFMRQLLEGLILFEQVELKHVNLNRIRPMIGGTIFKSYLIDSLEQQNGKYTMKGRGYGHGVGMSQWGAHFMGQRGKTYEEIISFYYPGTTIKHISDRSIKIAQ
ncbi:SpoIID/LytB domain-containing protein [Ornithinibacillus contaminans]|uniref:SpoIID/LytB domain-containing protein n=1 Tax=Ornithinibacillus contaminans TaxID=694055 RepID=UPI001F390DC6|nr:SpoIID/LytB domain-containing protein [Ornithinibacillus contaminans]